MSTLHLSFFLRPPAIQSQSQSVYLFFKVLRGTDTECWAAFYSLSPYCGSGSVLAGFRLPGLRDHHQSRSRSWVGQGAAGLTGRGPGPAWRKRRVTTVRKISLVAPQQPLEQQRARGQECSENEQIIALQTRNRCIHNPKTKVKLRLRLTRWGSKFIVTFPRRDYPRIKELWNAFMERNNKRGWDLLQLTTINSSRKIRLLRNVKADLPTNALSLMLHACWLQVINKKIQYSHSRWAGHLTPSSEKIFVKRPVGLPYGEEDNERCKR